MSTFSHLGVGVHLYEPIIRGGRYLDSLADKVSDWKSDSNCSVGFASASFSLALSVSDVQDWWTDGLGRHIVAYNTEALPCWEGFVNKLSFSYGGRSVTIGPLMDIANRVSVQYTPVDYTVYPPVRGATTTTVIVEDTASQALYGILEQIVSAGDCTVVDAEEVRNQYLAENSFPITAGDLDIRRVGQITQMQVELCGYGAWLDHFVYESIASGSTDIRTQMLAILTAEPNNILAASVELVSANALLVPMADNENRTGLTAINSLVCLGDAADVRYIFGVGPEREVYYKAVPARAKYQYRLSFSEDFLRTLPGEQIVQPWDVMPGEWVYFVDFFAGGDPAGSLYRDPSAMFIETCSFTAPRGLSLNGSRLSTLAQKMAKLGNGGII